MAKLPRLQRAGSWRGPGVTLGCCTVLGCRGTDSVRGHQPRCASLYLEQHRARRWAGGSVTSATPLLCAAGLCSSLGTAVARHGDGLALVFCIALCDLWELLLLGLHYGLLMELTRRGWGCLGLWMALGGPHLDLVVKSGCQGWELWHRMPSCAPGTATLPEVVGWGDSSLEICSRKLVLLSVSCHGELAVPAHPVPNPAWGQGWWRCLGRVVNSSFAIKDTS